MAKTVAALGGNVAILDVEEPVEGLPQLQEAYGQRFVFHRFGRLYFHKLHRRNDKLREEWPGWMLLRKRVWVWPLTGWFRIWAR